MKQRPRFADLTGIHPLPAGGAFDLGERLAGGSAWELEIGFGKGRYLLRRAETDRERRFVGIEIAGEYFALAARRLARRRIPNLLLLEGDAAYFATSLLPLRAFGDVHVYFPDPWPKLRHRKRRLFAADSVDLLAALVAPGGRLWFATDFLDYGESVRALLESYPGTRVIVHDEPWPDGARTNYEAKYLAEGRAILRLEVTFDPADPAHPSDPSKPSIPVTRPHPEGLRDLLVAARPGTARATDDIETHPDDGATP